MENIINTTKYTETIKNIFIVSAFLISSPAIVSAQYINAPIVRGIGDPMIQNQNVDNGNIIISDDYFDNNKDYLQSDNFDTITNHNYNIDTQPIYGDTDYVIGGGLYGNYDNYPSDYISGDINTNYGNYYGNYGYGSVYSTGSYYPYYYGSRWLTSGGYSGGASTYVAPSTYSVPDSSTVTSGSFVMGNSTYVEPSTYYTPDSSTVTSGGYSGGNNYYVSPANYYVPQTSNISSGNYSGIGLTSEVVPNQVLAYTDTNSNLDSVYLSDIPNTGFKDYSGALMFISVLMSWSAMLAYIFLNKKIKSQTVSAVAYVNQNKIDDINNSVTSNFSNRIASDNSDISKVEEYARMNKVLLSSDASTKLVKLSRLGKINASEYIRSVATGEWIAIGDNKIS